MRKTAAPKKVTMASLARAKERKRKKREKTYCLCGGPDSGKMVLCDTCKEWFHDVCLEENGIEVPWLPNGGTRRGWKLPCPKCNMRSKLPRN